MARSRGGTPPPSGSGRGGDDRAAAALARAVAELTHQLAVQAGLISANTAALNLSARRGGGAGRASFAGPDRGAGALAGGVAALNAKLIGTLAPLAAFSQLLNAHTSGFGTFLKTTQLVTTSLAGMFLPASIFASGVMIALSQVIQDPLIKTIREAGPELEALSAAARGVADQVRGLGAAAEAAGIPLRVFGGTLGPINEGLKQLGTNLSEVITVLGGVGLNVMRDSRGKQQVQESLTGKAPEGFLRPPDSMASPGTPEGFLRPPDSGTSQAGKASGSPTDRFMKSVREGMDLAMQSLRRQVGGQASFGGTDLTQVWRSGTLAGLNEDPIQAKMLQKMVEQVETMQQVLDELKKREAQYQ
jgi:hypothetical protein